MEWTNANAIKKLECHYDKMTPVLPSFPHLSLITQLSTQSLRETEHEPGLITNKTIIIIKHAFSPQSIYLDKLCNKYL